MLAGMDKGSIPVPRLEEVLAGARGKKRFSEGYNPVFYYPVRSRRASSTDYSRPLLDKIRFREQVIRIEPRQRKLVITTAGAYRYENLISTMPLQGAAGHHHAGAPFPRAAAAAHFHPGGQRGALPAPAPLSLALPAGKALSLLPRRLLSRVGNRSPSTWKKPSPPAPPSTDRRLLREMAFTLRRIGHDRARERDPVP